MALALGAIAPVHATPLDKLIGKSLAVGNLMFSNIVLYTVTDLTGQLARVEQVLNATAFGQANVFYFTQASPSPGFVANNQLTVLDSCAIAPAGGVACEQEGRVRNDVPAGVRAPVRRVIVEAARAARRDTMVVLPLFQRLAEIKSWENIPKSAPW